MTQQPIPDIVAKDDEAPLPSTHAAPSSDQSDTTPTADYKGEHDHMLAAEGETYLLWAMYAHW